MILNRKDIVKTQVVLYSLLTLGSYLFYDRKEKIDRVGTDLSSDDNNEQHSKRNRRYESHSRTVFLNSPTYEDYPSNHTLGTLRSIVMIPADDMSNLSTAIIKEELNNLESIFVEFKLIDAMNSEATKDEEKKMITELIKYQVALRTRLINLYMENIENI